MEFLASICSVLIWLGWYSPCANVDVRQDRDSNSHAQIVVCIDGGEVLTVLSDVSYERDGKPRCLGEIKGQDNTWSLAWNFSLDLDARNGGNIRGKTFWMNSGDEYQTCVLKVMFPVDPVIQAGAVAQSSVDIQVSTTRSSGRAEVLKGGAGWSLLVDGHRILPIMSYPYFLTASHSKEIIARKRTGSPDEWSPIGGIEDSLGFKTQWSIGPGDSMSVSTNLAFGGEPGQFLKRRDTSSAIVIGSQERALRITTGSSRAPSSPSKKSSIRVRPQFPRDGNKILRTK